MSQKQLLLQVLDEAYDKRAWHGPNLQQSIEGVSARQAAWRPGRGRHNIWEEVVHAAYWKYAVRRRLLEEKRGSFALKGSNWFSRSQQGANEAAWRADRALLEREHAALRRAVAQTADTPRGRKLLRHIYGIALHDAYHAGQIRLLRRLMGARSARDQGGSRRHRRVEAQAFSVRYFPASHTLTSVATPSSKCMREQARRRMQPSTVETERSIL